MNTSTLTGLLAQNRLYQSHRRKIESIMTRSSHSLSFRKRDVLNNFYTNHERAQRYTQLRKQQAVQKQNDLILKKIIDVNRRSSHSNHSNSSREISHNNLSNLRKKLMKTNQENLRFANKLVGTTSKLSQTILSADYRRHAEIKQRIKKYTNDPDTGLVVPKKIKSLVKLGRLDSIKGDLYSSRVDNEEN